MEVKLYFCTLWGRGRVQTGKGPLRNQGNKREQGSREIGGTNLWRQVLWKLIQLASKSNFFGITFARMEVAGMFQSRK